jgi:hypothetical protein
MLAVVKTGRQDLRFMAQLRKLSVFSPAARVSRIGEACAAPSTRRARHCEAADELAIRSIDTRQSNPRLTQNA